MGGREGESNTSQVQTALNMTYIIQEKSNRFYSNIFKKLLLIKVFCYRHYAGWFLTGLSRDWCQAVRTVTPLHEEQQKQEPFQENRDVFIYCIYYFDFL